MHILLLGYGKMGKIIEEIALSRGHQIIARISEENRADRDTLTAADIDVAIEFSAPEAAVDNITWALERGIRVVSGTTGWLSEKPRLDALALAQNSAFFYASNFSIGVNIFFKVNAFLAKLMQEQSAYQVAIEEIHHTEKKDAPSGTALTLAEGVMAALPAYSGWTLAENMSENDTRLPITAKRIDPAPGTHTVTYSSEIDTLSINHTAHSRQGFALGAVLVAEWIKDKKGILSMDDFLSF